MKILHIGLSVQPPPYNGLQKAFIENSTEYKEINCGEKNLNEKIITILDNFIPEIVFLQIQSPNIIHNSTIQTLKEKGCYVMNWTGDVRSDVPKWMLQIEPNITLFSNMRDVYKTKSFGMDSDYLEIGYDPEIYQPEGASLNMPEIVFFGNNYGNQFPMGKFRFEMVNELKRYFGPRFGVYGNGWENGDGNFNHSQIEEAKAYRGTKIAINCSHFEIERYTSDRMLRILGTGVPICLAKHYPSIELDYPDLTLKTWNSIDELKKACDYYLENESIRKFIAKNGNYLARTKFTFDHMVKNIIKIYEARKN